VAAHVARRDLAGAEAALAQGRAAAGLAGTAWAAAVVGVAEAVLALARGGSDSAAARASSAASRRPARDATGGGGAPAGLTAREDEIARLVAAGRTNREIAEQLVLSPRTVEAHLRSVYGKLGVRTRVELARDLRTGR